MYDTLTNHKYNVKYINGDYMNKKIYVSSCCENGGIYVFDIKNNQLEQTQFIPVDRPMYTVIDNSKLYAILRAPFTDNENSGVISFDIDENGNLYNRKDISSTLGECGCHLYVENDDIYVTNYISGNIIKCPDKLVQHKDENVIKEAHTHFVGITPDHKYLLVTDLGLDKIFIYVIIDFGKRLVKDSNLCIRISPDLRIPANSNT